MGTVNFCMDKTQAVQRIINAYCLKTECTVIFVEYFDYKHPLTFFIGSDVVL